MLQKQIMKQQKAATDSHNYTSPAFKIFGDLIRFES